MIQMSLPPLPLLALTNHHSAVGGWAAAAAAVAAVNTVVVVVVVVVVVTVGHCRSAHAATSALPAATYVVKQWRAHVATDSCKNAKFALSSITCELCRRFSTVASTCCCRSAALHVVSQTKSNGSVDDVDGTHVIPRIPANSGSRRLMDCGPVMRYFTSFAAILSEEHQLLTLEMEKWRELQKD